MRVRFNGWELDLRSQQLSDGNRTVRLQSKPFRLLRLLLERSGEVVTRDEIQEALWPKDTDADVEHGVNVAIGTLRRELKDSATGSTYIETLPTVGYRFLVRAEWPPKTLAVGEPQAPAAGLPSGEFLAREDRPEQQTIPLTRSNIALRVAIPSTVIIFAILGLGVYYRLHRSTPFKGEAPIVLAEFSNTTGEVVFDDALRQGLAAHLSQSPFLQLLSEVRIARTLTRMSRPANARLTPGLAREVCQRAAGSAVIEGSIAKMDAQYVLGLKAVSCVTGNLLASEQAVAPNRQHVLSELGKAADRMRVRLGESPASLQKYDVPLDEVTTSSIEALKAYSLGVKALNAVEYSAAIDFGKRAADLDPDFAMAYALLGTSYSSISESELAADNIQKAYRLRARAGERERFEIECHYLLNNVGDIDAAIRQYTLWIRAYPRDGAPINNRGNLQLLIGDYEGALNSYRRVVDLFPDSNLPTGNLAFSYVFLNRPADAENVVRQAQAKGMNSPDMRMVLYLVGYLRRDDSAMREQEAILVKTPGWDNQLFEFESDRSGSQGRLTEARALTRRAVQAAERAQEKEVAASYIAESAVRDALVGSYRYARQEAHAALVRSNASGVEAMAAIGLALAGNRTEASRLAADLGRRFPQDGVVRFNYIPVIDATVALPRDSAKGLQALESSERFEMGLVENAASFSGYPVYFRGEAYLVARQGAAAAKEFQKLINHPGIVRSEPIGVLAHLGLARADSLSGDTEQAKREYDVFLGLWKDADHGIPLHMQARAERAALR